MANGMDTVSCEISLRIPKGNCVLGLQPCIARSNIWWKTVSLRSRMYGLIPHSMMNAATITVLPSLVVRGLWQRSDAWRKLWLLLARGEDCVTCFLRRPLRRHTNANARV